jgi:hypothetical protein
MDELFASGIKLAYAPDYSFVLEIGDETEVSKVYRNLANCPSYFVCVDWAKFQKNVSILLADTDAELRYAIGDTIDENSNPMLCGLEDGVILTASRTMMMFLGDPLMRRVNEVIDHVVEAGLYKHWISLEYNSYSLLLRKIAIVQPFDEYYSFNLIHMQTAFYLLMTGWYLGALSLMIEVLYNRVLSKVM